MRNFTALSLVAMAICGLSMQAVGFFDSKSAHLSDSILESATGLDTYTMKITDSCTNYILAPGEVANCAGVANNPVTQCVYCDVPDFYNGISVDSGGGAVAGGFMACNTQRKLRGTCVNNLCNNPQFVGFCIGNPPYYVDQL